MLRYGVTCIACVMLVLLALRDGGPGSSPAVPGPVELATESRAPAIVQPRSAQPRDRELTRRRGSPRRTRATSQARRRLARHAAPSSAAALGGTLSTPGRDGPPAAGDGEPGSSRTVGSRPRRPGGGRTPSPGAPSAPAVIRTDLPAAAPAPAPVSAPAVTPVEQDDDVELTDDDDPAELAEEVDDGD